MSGSLSVSHLLRGEDVRQVLPQLLEDAIGVILALAGEQFDVPLVHGGGALALGERIRYRNTRGSHGGRVGSAGV